jgi:hypothetical protein
VITRSRTTAQLQIKDGTSLVDSSTSTNIYSDITSQDLSFTTKGSINLLGSFYQSMLIGTEGTRTYVISVDADSVTISETGVSPDVTVSLKNYTLYTFAGTDYKIVSERITAGGMANPSADSESYQIYKDQQYVEIEYSSAYVGSPSGLSFKPKLIRRCFAHSRYYLIWSFWITC